MPLFFKGLVPLGVARQVLQAGTIGFHSFKVEKDEMRWQVGSTMCPQAVATPFVGSAGNVLNRIFLAAAGTFIWGITSVGIGAARSFSQVSGF
jgi:hypothetical protein